MSNFTNNNEQECCICFEIIGIKNNCVTPCGHSFCFQCMSKSLAQNNTCPMCRSILMEIDDDISEDIDGESDFNDDDEDDEEDDEDDDYNNDENIDEINERFLKAGYNSIDVMSMLTGRFKRSDPKNTKTYIDEMYETFDKIVNEVDSEEEERKLMFGEDTKTPIYDNEEIDKIVNVLLNLKYMHVLNNETSQ